MMVGLCTTMMLFPENVISIDQGAKPIESKPLAVDDTTGIRAAYLAATGFSGSMVLYPSESFLNGSLPRLTFTAESDTAYMHTLADSIVYGYLPFIKIPAEQVKFSKLIIYRPYWYHSDNHFFFKYQQMINGIMAPGYIYIDFENNKPQINQYTGSLDNYPHGPRFYMCEMLLRTADKYKEIKVTREQALDMMHSVKMPALNDSIGNLFEPYPVSINLQYGCQLYCHWLDKRPRNKMDHVRPDTSIRLLWHMRWKGYLMDVDAVTGEVINSMSFVTGYLPKHDFPNKLVTTPEQAVDCALDYDRNYNTLMHSCLSEYISTAKMKFNGEFYWEACSPFSYLTDVEVFTGRILEHGSDILVN
ncbi:MAG TPA: hypothetical protein PL124_11735 [Candidatus Cloacimonadota bacterium]|nr:hypothetical protein [Candidatus Cloacimonadota bacterium]